MCERVNEDLRHETRHVDIQVGNVHDLLECLFGCHCMST